MLIHYEASVLGAKHRLQGRDSQDHCCARVVEPPRTFGTAGDGGPDGESSVIDAAPRQAPALPAKLPWTRRPRRIVRASWCRVTPLPLRACLSVRFVRSRTRPSINPRPILLRLPARYAW